MAIKIPAMPSPAAPDLARLASVVGEPLPDSYLRFVAHHDGAEPQSNVIDVGNDNQSGVRQFIAVSAAPAIFSDVEGFPPHAIPLAEDDCGNFFYMIPSNGQVFFWDQEIENGDQFLAGDLDSFLSDLEPFDASSIKLVPGQVKRAWIDPDFKPEF